MDGGGFNTIIQNLPPYFYLDLLCNIALIRPIWITYKRGLDKPLLHAYFDFIINKNIPDYEIKRPTDNQLFQCTIFVWKLPTVHMVRS